MSPAPVSGAPRMLLILSENWTMTDGRDLPRLVRWAREAEDAGFDAVMLSEHIVLGPDAGAHGLMPNPASTPCPATRTRAHPGPVRCCCCPRSPPPPSGYASSPAPSSPRCATRCTWPRTWPPSTCSPRDGWSCCPA
nr:LLM class flavin-dependent oxidoreductase [Phytohabitans rumicis]